MARKFAYITLLVVLLGPLAAFPGGLEYRIAGHCGGGARRLNIDTDVAFCFVGCSAAPQSNAPQDPAEWTMTRSVLTAWRSECFNVTTSLPGSIPVGAMIKS